MYKIATNEAAVIFQLDPYAIDTIGMNEWRKIDGQHGHSEGHG